MKAQINLSSSEYPHLIDVMLLCKMDVPKFLGFYVAEKSDGQIIKIHQDQIKKIYDNSKTPDCPLNS